MAIFGRCNSFRGRGRRNPQARWRVLVPDYFVDFVVNCTGTSGKQSR